MNDATAKDEPDDLEVGYKVYAAYLEHLVVDQESRKKSLEERGLSVLTTSAALVSLLFGLVAVVTGVDDFTLPNAARPPLAIAMVLFVVAAVLGLITNFPRNYSNAQAEGLTTMFGERWEDSEPIAQRRVSVTQQQVYAKARGVNGDKAKCLFAAMFIEVVAVIFLTISVAVILAD